MFLFICLFFFTIFFFNKKRRGQLRDPERRRLQLIIAGTSERDDTVMIDSCSSVIDRSTGYLQKKKIIKNEKSKTSTVLINSSN